MPELSLGGYLVLFFVTVFTVYFCASRFERWSQFSTRNYKKMPLLTQNEARLHLALLAAVGRDGYVAPQVVFGAFIAVKATAVVNKNNARHQMAHNRADFVVLNLKYEVIAVVELDDSSHDNYRQRGRDARRDNLMKAVGIRALRYRGALPSTKKLRADIGL